jgi:hypothetical protein
MLSGMETRRWVNQGHPQTLQIVVLLLYLRAVFTVFGLKDQYLVFPGSSISGDHVSNPLLQIGLPALMVAAGFLTANERKLGWNLALVAAALPLLGRVMLLFGVSLGVSIDGSYSPFDYDPIGLLLEVALLALVLHPQSRDYERIWFK